MIQVQLQTRSQSSGSGSGSRSGSGSSQPSRNSYGDEHIVDLDALETALDQNLPTNVRVIVDCASFNGQSITLRKEVDARTELVVVGSQAAGRNDSPESDVSACGFFWLLIGITFQVYSLVTIGTNLGSSVKLGWDIMTIFLHLWNLTTVVVLINTLQDKDYDRICEVYRGMKCFSFIFFIYSFVWSTRTLKVNFFEVFKTRDAGPRIINISDTEPYQFYSSESQTEETIFCYPPGTCELNSVVIFGSIGIAMLAYFAYYMCFLKMAAKARDSLRQYDMEHLQSLEIREDVI